jgi:cold shock CspA family protein
VLKGTIAKLLSKDQGGPVTFGFITGDDHRELFFHGGAMDQMAGVRIHDLLVGDRVEFDEATHPKGPRAIGVRRV